MSAAIRITAAIVLVTVAGTALALRTPHFAMSPVDAGVFSAAALVRPPATVDCVLENGTSARCLQVVVKYVPDGMRIGPFCPPTVNDVGGIWDWDGTNAGLYRLDAAF